MSSHYLDHSSCGIVPGFCKSGHKYHQKGFSDGFEQILVLEVAYISYNTGTHSLPWAVGHCAYVSADTLLPVL